jgi:hypothetical protein
MSLVHEALQKAEREKQRKLGTTPSAPVSHAAPQTIAPAVVHTPVGPASVAHVAPATVPHKPAAIVEEPTETNDFLLPGLIGCVAIVAIIAIVFIVSNATSVLRQPKESSPVAVTAAIPTATAQTAPAAAPQPTAAQTPAESAAPVNVPPPVAPVTDESKYKISGIMKDPDGKPVAVLNGRVAYEGYFIDGATVKKIETDRVTLDIKGRELVLRLY